jgi:GLPGLI family protein
MKFKLFILILLLSGSLAQAQKFITEGRIEFERKVNQHSFMEEGDSWDEQMKKVTPKFYTTYYDLVFKNGVTMYKTGRDPDIKQNKVNGVFEAENTILTYLDSSKALTQKNIFNDYYLVSDSIRKIDWKIGTEIRPIAGFNCRKAVGKVMDSVIVIAFYTDEIIPSGGPESFAGLPGMILGLAIPRMHTTWYATKLQLVEVTDKELAAPKKGKKIAGPAFNSQIKETFKDWGSYGKRVIPQVLL